MKPADLVIKVADLGLNFRNPRIERLELVVERGNVWKFVRHLFATEKVSLHFLNGRSATNGLGDVFCDVIWSFSMFIDFLGFVLISVENVWLIGIIYVYY